MNGVNVRPELIEAWGRVVEASESGDPVALAEAQAAAERLTPKERPVQPRQERELSR